MFRSCAGSPAKRGRQLSDGANKSLCDALSDTTIAVSMVSHPGAEGEDSDLAPARYFAPFAHLRA